MLTVHPCALACHRPRSNRNWAWVSRRRASGVALPGLGLERLERASQGAGTRASRLPRRPNAKNLYEVGHLAGLAVFQADDGSLRHPALRASWSCVRFRFNRCRAEALAQLGQNLSIRCLSRYCHKCLFWQLYHLNDNKATFLAFFFRSPDEHLLAYEVSKGPIRRQAAPYQAQYQYGSSQGTSVVA